MNLNDMAYRRKYNSKRKRTWSAKRRYRGSYKKRKLRVMRNLTYYGFFKKTYVYSSATWSASGSGNVMYKLIDLYNADNDIGPLFNWYRIRRVVTRFMVTKNVAEATAAWSGLGYVYTIVNTGRQTVTNASNFPNYGSFKMWRWDQCDGKQSVRVVSPKPIMQQSDSVQTYDWRSGSKTWIYNDNAQTVYHRGLDYYVEVPSGASCVLTIWNTMYLSCKEPRA